MRNKRQPQLYPFSIVNKVLSSGKDDYNKVSQRALEGKKQQVLEKWFKEHIPNYYITIDNGYAGCTGISEWLNVSNVTNR